MPRVYVTVKIERFLKVLVEMGAGCGLWSS
jgi:hypothetical protein